MAIGKSAGSAAFLLLAAFSGGVALTLIETSMRVPWWLELVVIVIATCVTGATLYLRHLLCRQPPHPNATEGPWVVVASFTAFLLLFLLGGTRDRYVAAYGENEPWVAGIFGGALLFAGLVYWGYALCGRVMARLGRPGLSRPAAIMGAIVAAVLMQLGMSQSEMIVALSSALIVPTPIFALAWWLEGRLDQRRRARADTWCNGALRSVPMRSVAKMVAQESSSESLKDASKK